MTLLEIAHVYGTSNVQEADGAVIFRYPISLARKRRSEDEEIQQKSRSGAATHVRASSPQELVKRNEHSIANEQSAVSSLIKSAGGYQCSSAIQV
jgi:hypothetical protein